MIADPVEGLESSFPRPRTLSCLDHLVETSAVFVLTKYTLNAGWPRPTNTFFFWIGLTANVIWASDDVFFHPQLLLPTRLYMEKSVSRPFLQTSYAKRCQWDFGKYIYNVCHRWSAERLETALSDGRHMGPRRRWPNIEPTMSRVCWVAYINKIYIIKWLLQ